MRSRLDRGFTLIEALVAALLVSVAVAGLAQLVTAAAAQIGRAGEAALALALAQAKLEELRGWDWGFTADGSPVSDARLALSPELSLVNDRDGYTEALGRFGEWVPSLDEAHFRRRWAIALWDRLDPDTLLLQACVFRHGTPRPGARANACVWTIRTRKP